MKDERDCEHCEHYKDMLIGIGIDEHTVKCCELWDCEKEKKNERIRGIISREEED